MICSVTWQDGDTILDVAEVNTNDKVGITMYDEDNIEYGHYIELQKHDVIRLIDWLKKSLEDLPD